MVSSTTHELENYPCILPIFYDIEKQGFSRKRDEDGKEFTKHPP